MKKTVGIIGAAGYVGQGMVRLFRIAYKIIECDISDVRHYDAIKRSSAEWDLAVVCVPTPMAADGRCDTSIVEDVVSWCEAPLILVKSTVPPGTCDALGLAYKKAVHFSPEYMGEPKNYVAPWRTPDPRRPETHSWVTVGGPRADEVMNFLTPCMANDARYRITDNRSAEMAKYMENCYFAMKIAFCNEFAKLCAQIGVSYHEVRDLWLLDPRINGDHTIVFPNAPFFAGKCLPKDLSGLVHFAQQVGVDLPVLSMVFRDNEQKRAAAKHQAWDKTKPRMEAAQ